jgi:phosphoenolpyruvate carboxylase
VRRATEVRRRRPDEELAELSAPLRADVRFLSSALGDVIAESGGKALLDDVERLRKAAIKLRESRGVHASDELDHAVRFIDRLELSRAEAVARAFTVYFQLVNLAEERHRVRILRQRSREESVIAESLRATVAELRSDLGEEGLGVLLAQLEIRPILTAHPTEARRRAVVDALGRIARVMDLLDDERLSAGERADARRRLDEEISILWRTSQLRQVRPSPLDEVRSVMAFFDQSLFTLVPVLYRELERALSAGGHGPDAVDVPSFLRWGSWVGGDRDGNPHVTSELTEAALAIQAEHILSGLEAAARRIGRSLTLSEDSTPASGELGRRLERSIDGLGAAGREILTHSPGEPHRAFLLMIAERLKATRLDDAGKYDRPDEFRSDLRSLRDSLLAAGAAREARGELQHLIWQAETFGFHLASLEVRQHAAVHRAMVSELLPEAADDARRLDAIAQGLDVPDAAAVPRSETARDTFATFQAMARLQRRFGPEACRRYVVSFTRSPADLVSVAALARLAVPEAGLEVDVVPLFESRADLEAAPQVLDGLLELPGRRRWLERHGRRFEVMLGYSDATKDVGFLAANLALYRAQAALVSWARRNDIQLTLFHGRGGAVGRGGGPAGRAIRSQAPGSLSGRFKVTEQGEVIYARYGNPAIALRHLEQVTSAVLIASTARHEELLAGAEQRYRDAADVMAQASEAAYRELVESPGFAEFFAAVTPVEEIAQLAIGSRPARRGGGTARSLDDLRAIPWVFAWTQNRCNLPGWFGLGTGMQVVVDREGLPFLRRMVAEWPLMASIVDNAEMSLAKADPMIAGLYLDRGGRPELVAAIREEYRRTRRLVLELTGKERLLAGHPILRLAVDLRNPYVDALSFLQLRFLRELREADAERAEQLGRLVRLTVGGIAAGLQNTG